MASQSIYKRLQQHNSKGEPAFLRDCPQASELPECAGVVPAAEVTCHFLKPFSERKVLVYGEEGFSSRRCANIIC